MEGGQRRDLAVSLAAFVAVLAVTWRWFDVDEFVNLQQAIRANQGFALYLETPSHHPPLYTWMLQGVVALPGSDLLAARLASVLLAWGAGALVWDVIRRHASRAAGRMFIFLWSSNAFVLLSGTRAMNEVPVLFLLAAALWLLERGRDGFRPGAAAGTALLARFTSAFYLPAFLFLAQRRGPKAVGSAGMVVLAGLGILALTARNSLSAFLDGTILFHAGRPSEEFLRRLGKTLWWSSAPLVISIAALVPMIRDRGSRWVRAGTAALAGGLLMVFLPSAHVHYFLPLAIVSTAACAFAAEQTPRRVRGAIIFFALLVPLSQGILTIPMTPHNDLEDSNDVAAWVRANTPPSTPILTDAPQYAVLSGRENVGGYFWSLRHDVPMEDLERAANGSSVVIVSERFGHYDRGFPRPFLDLLASEPCTVVAGARVYWVAPGPAPNGMATCP